MSRHSFSGRAAQKMTRLVLQEYGNICHLCGLPGATTADHLIPRSHGGDNSLENMRPACSHCNSARGNMSLQRWFEKQKKERDRGRYAPAQPLRSSAKPSREW